MLFVALNFMATSWTDEQDQFHALAEESAQRGALHVRAPELAGRVHGGGGLPLGLLLLRRGGLLLLEAKDDAKKRGLKSPDRGDSLALTFAIPGGATQQTVIPAGALRDYAIDNEMGL